MRPKLLRKTVYTFSALALLLVVGLSVLNISASLSQDHANYLSTNSAYVSVPAQHAQDTFPLTALELEEDEDEKNDEEPETFINYSCSLKKRNYSNKYHFTEYLLHFSRLQKLDSQLYFTDTSPPTFFI